MTAKVYEEISKFVKSENITLSKSFKKYGDNP